MKTTVKHFHPKAVIFDFDDTLVRTREAKWRQHQAVAKQFYGIDLTEQELLAHWGKPYDDTLSAYYQNRDTVENMRKAKESLEDAFPIEAEQDAQAVVSTLHDKGCLIAIVSSSRRAMIISDLTRLGFDISCFTHIQASDETKIHKPDGAVFEPTLKVLAAQGVTDGIVYVGDALNDYLASRAAGLDFIGITTGLTTREQFQAAGVTEVIKRLGELLT